MSKYRNVIELKLVKPLTGYHVYFWYDSDGIPDIAEISNVFYAEDLSVCLTVYVQDNKSDN